jgi:hypothetical protein
LTQNITQFTVADPSTFDGDPFEVGERACLQSAALAGILLDSLGGTRLMVRNAELERQLLTSGECDAPAFDESPQGKKLATLLAQTKAAVKTLETLATAAAYNPKNPPRP